MPTSGTEQVYSRRVSADAHPGFFSPCSSKPPRASSSTRTGRRRGPDPDALSRDRGGHRVRAEVRNRDHHDANLIRVDVLPDEVGERLPFNPLAKLALEVRPVVDLERCFEGSHDRLSGEVDAQCGRLVARVKRRGEVVSGLVGSRGIVGAAGADRDERAGEGGASGWGIERRRVSPRPFSVHVRNGIVDLLTQQISLERGIAVHATRKSGRRFLYSQRNGLV